MPAQDQKLGEKLFRRADKLRTKRDSVFSPQWQQLSQYFWPDVSDINTEKTESTENWFDRIYETTAIRAAATCSIGVRNWVTPSTEPWLDLAPPYNLTKRSGSGATSMNPRIARISSPQAPQVDDNGMDDATRWCKETATQLLQELSASPFYAVVQPFNRSACTFGTALMLCEEGKQTLFRFEQFKIGTYCIAENDEKIVDTVFRWFKLTVRQAVQRFCPQGEDGEYDVSNLPEKIRKRWEAEKFDEEFKFIHCVFPNDEMRAGAIGPEGMAFASVYLAEEGKHVVKQDGYEEMPYFALRWSRWGSENEVWGCSPAFECLADARQLNAVEQYDDALVELLAYPRVFVPDSLDGNVEMASGAATVIRAEDMAKGIVPKEWLTQGSRQDIAEKQAKKAKAINDAFFVDVFKALSELESKITESTYGAIALLKGEKADQFTGTFDQYRTEMINPLVLRMLGIMQRSGRLKDPPQSLMVQPDDDPKAAPELAAPRIAIKSRVTAALNEFKNLGLQKTVELWGPIIEQKPELWDNLNGDQAFRRSGMDNGMPMSDFRPLKEVAALREQRQKMVAQQNALANAEQAASAAGKLGKAPPKFQDAAGSMLEGAQQQPAA